MRFFCFLGVDWGVLGVFLGWGQGPFAATDTPPRKACGDPVFAARKMEENKQKRVWGQVNYGRANASKLWNGCLGVWTRIDINCSPNTRKIIQIYIYFTLERRLMAYCRQLA